MTAFPPTAPEHSSNSFGGARAGVIMLGRCLLFLAVAQQTSHGGGSKDRPALCSEVVMPTLLRSVNRLCMWRTSKGSSKSRPLPEPLHKPHRKQCVKGWGYASNREELRHANSAPWASPGLGLG